MPAPAPSPPCPPGQPPTSTVGGVAAAGLPCETWLLLPPLPPAAPAAPKLPPAPPPPPALPVPIGPSTPVTRQPIGVRAPAPSAGTPPAAVSMKCDDASSVPSIVIDWVATRTSGLVAVAPEVTGLSAIARTVAPVGMSIVGPGMMQIDGPPVCVWISVQPVVAATAPVVIVPVSETGVVGILARHTLPTRWPPRQTAPPSGLPVASPPASTVVPLRMHTPPFATATQLWPLGQLSRAGSHGAPPANVGE